jgi:hypothetical protein
MAQQNINVGVAPNDGSGDTLRGAFTKTQDNFTELYGSVGSLAPLNSPSLTGVPTAPTASAGTNTNQIATTAFVVATAPDPIPFAIALG